MIPKDEDLKRHAFWLRLIPALIVAFGGASLVVASCSGDPRLGLSQALAIWGTVSIAFSLGPNAPIIGTWSDWWRGEFSSTMPGMQSAVTYRPGYLWLGVSMIAAAAVI